MFSISPTFAMVINAMQQLDDILVTDAIEHFRTIAAAFQNAFILHHIKLLTGYRLFAPQGLDDIADAHFFLLKQLDDLKPDRMGYCF